MKRTLASAAAAGALLFSLSAAQAAIQTYTFTATVNPSSQGLDLTGPNASVVGSFSFDDALTASLGPYPHGSVWFSAVQSFSFAMGALSGSAVTPVAPHSVLVYNNFDATTAGPFEDRFSITPIAMTGPARGANALQTADLWLASSNLALFTAPVLPTAPMSLASFDLAQTLRVTYANGDTVYATINSLTPVPEPSEWMLLAAGLGVVFGARRRRAGSPRRAGR